MKLTTSTTFVSLILTSISTTLASALPPAYPSITGPIQEGPLTVADNDATTPALDKRLAAGIYYCRNNDWKGPCAHTLVTVGKCMNFQQGWNDNINSFGPDRGAFYCILYSNAGCTGAEPKFRFKYPGTPKTASWGIDGRVSSVKCFYG
ncbi:hypothetical protein MPH_06287 [Macrophomina phaseolina MS6]|uniref:Beta/gamma crystallin n=2 Tax=Macrophomina phaseolina TaxID=35725 RepID=K2R2M7_MACPH|nr:hypothetical protein MPH_06287 [Macrophomina phaseolina MS6]KAH7063605.1 hypothetical protein B0J12DRAFT_759142 [Macrophomina phaseolina]